MQMGLAPEEVRAFTKGRCRSCWGRLVGRRDRKTEEQFMRRISANAAKGGKAGWLTRKDFPPGSTMTRALMSAFACELAMKAIRLTRLDEARKQHDLLALYRDLPEDSRTRMEMDYPGIEAILQKARHTFGKWRYFETKIEGGGIRSYKYKHHLKVEGTETSRPIKTNIRRPVN